MLERWLVKILVTRDPDVDAHPGEWNWDVEGADTLVLDTQIVGLVALAQVQT